MRLLNREVIWQSVELRDIGTGIFFVQWSSGTVGKWGSGAAEQRDGGGEEQ
jgi:hypothetical protein